MVISSTVRPGRLRVERVKSMRALRPISKEMNSSLISALRRQWRNVPLAEHNSDIAKPESRFIRTFMNRKEELFAMVKHSTESKGVFLLRIFQVDPRSLKLSEMADAQIGITNDKVKIITLAKVNAPSLVAPVPRHIHRPRGMDFGRVVVEEAIRLARKKGLHIIELDTTGPKKVEYYQRFGFRQVPSPGFMNTIRMQLWIRE